MTEPPSPSSQGAARPPNLFPGILAVLKDTKCHQFPRDEDELRNSKLLLNGKRRKRKPESPLVVPVSLETVIAENQFTLLFFFHPRHKHSIQLRSIVSEFCARDDTGAECIAMFGGNSSAATGEEQDDCELFFHGTGFLEISREDEAGNNACNSLLKFLDVTQIPSLVVIPNARGRPILGQEIALEWNAASNDDESIKALVERWGEGSSGLTLSQGLVSKVVGDSSAACALM